MTKYTYSGGSWKPKSSKSKSSSGDSPSVAGLKAAKAALAKKSSSSSSYRGPSAAQIKAGTLEVGGSPSSRQASKDNARIAALVQSGIRGGQTSAQATSQAIRTVHGGSSSSTQAKRYVDGVYYANSTKRARAQREYDAKLAAAKQVAEKAAKIATSKKIAADKKTADKIAADKKKVPIIAITPPSLKKTISGHLPDLPPAKGFQTAPSLAGQTVTKYPSAKTTITQKQKELDVVHRKLHTDAKTLKNTRAQLTTLEARINNAPIKNGVFVGTEAQYNKYQADFKLYDAKYKQVGKQITAYNTDLRVADIKGTQMSKLEDETRRAKWGGLAGKIEDAEAKIKASKYRTPTAAEAGTSFDILRLTNKNVNTVMKQVDKMKKQTKTTVHTGPSGKQAEHSTPTMVAKATQFITSIPPGMVQGIHDKPLTATASLALGVVTPPVIKGAGVVGKAVGLGAKSAKVGKVAMVGVGGMYATDVAGRTVVDLPASLERKKFVSKGLTPAEMGRTVGDIMSTELIPLGVGAAVSVRGGRVLTSTTRAIKTKIAKGKALTVAEMNAQMKAIAIISDVGMVGSPRLKTKTTVKSPPPRTKIDTSKTFEQFMAEQAAREKALRVSVARSMKESASARQRILDRTTKLKMKTTGAPKQKIDTKNVFADAGTHVKTKYDVHKPPVTKLKNPRDEIARYRARQALVDKRYKTGIINKAVHTKQTKMINKKINDIKAFYTDVYKPAVIKQKGIKTRTTVKTGVVLSAAAMISLITDARAQIATSTKAAEKSAIKTAVKPAIKPAQRAKMIPATKRIVRTSTDTRIPVETPTKTKTTVSKTKPQRKPILRSRAMPPTVPPVLPPVVPLPTRKTKRETKKTGKQTVEYTSTQMLNRVATLKSLFG